jgi:hypothetical protein
VKLVVNIEEQNRQNKTVFDFQEEAFRQVAAWISVSDDSPTFSVHETVRDIHEET